MIDPIGAYRRVAESVVSYIETAFGTQFPSLELERGELLRAAGALCQEPWIEPLPRYESSGKTIAQLSGSDVPGLQPNAVEDFKALASCGLVGDFPLHRHQVEMLTKALERWQLRNHCRDGIGQNRVIPPPAVRLPGAANRRPGNPQPRPIPMSTTGGQATRGAITATR